MEWEVSHRPAYTLLKIFLEPEEEVSLESGAYMAHKGDVEIRTHTGGGLLSAISRRIFAGESIFFNALKAKSKAEVWAAPNVPGDILGLKIEKPIVIQDTSLLAYTGNVQLSVSFSFKRFWLERQFAWLKASGTGYVWICSYGGLETVYLKPGEKMTIDNLHFVAMDDSLKYRTRKFGSWKSTIFGGEGLVIEVEGPGRVWLQSRIIPGFVEAILPYIPKR